jgi:hypothetical protein
VLTIVEAGKRRKAGDVAEWPKVEGSRATVMLFPGALLSIADVVAGFLVTPGEGCAECVDPDDQDSGTGGNIPAYYVTDPGSVELGLSDTGCDGAPIIGPETVDAAAGDRVALIPYGTSLSDLSLLVVPVDRPLAAATSGRRR